MTHLIIKNEDIRKKHPQAGRFSYALWRYIFQYRLSEAELSVIEGGLINSTRDNEFSEDQAIKLLLCTLVSNVKSTTNDLLKYALTRLKLSNQAIFFCAALTGDFELLKKIANKVTEDEIKTVFFEKNKLVFSSLVQLGKLETLKYFEKKLGDDRLKSAIKAEGYYAYQKAATNGHQNILEYFESKLSDDELKQAIEIVYRWTTASGHKHIIEYFENKFGKDGLKEAIKLDNYYAYQLAAANGHQHILAYFEGKISDDELKTAIKADGYLAYQKAAENGHQIIIEYFESKLGIDGLKEAIKAKNYRAYQWASKNGHQAVLEYFESKLGDDELTAIRSYDYHAYQFAAINGHQHILAYFQSKLSDDELIAAIKTKNYYAYRRAAINGHQHILTYFESKLSKEELKAAIKQNNYSAYKQAAVKSRKALVDYLMQTDNCFAYAESHDKEYGKKYVYPYVTRLLNSLASEKSDFETSNPNGVFDVSINDATLYYYVLRNLIRRGVDRDYHSDFRQAEDLSNEIRFLLSIPSVRLLAHQNVTVDEERPGQENELLRLAMRLENQEAAEILLGLPEVYQLAQQHNFYERERQGDLDLREIARDRESSMVALSPAERKKVAKAKAYYTDSIKNQGGENAVFEQLKADLENRYLNNPATITLKQADGTEIDMSLPFEWQEFQRFKQHQSLTESQYQAALEAYYKHESHTAYRYLSKPNYWMASNASFVYVLRDENGMVTSHRYSTFEDYKPLIVLFYTAVCDEAAPAIDGHTHEGRVELFIKQLALIGRAHNWDDSRAKLDEAGNQQFDANGHLITEEYDNLQGDKPSCYSGVKRRLFQSVLGHGLFKVLTADIVKQTVREQLRLYFNTKISKENAKTLKKAYDGICCLDDDIETHLNTLRVLDMDDSERDNIIVRVAEQLDNAFLGQFSDNKIQFENVINRYIGARGQPDIMTYGDSLSLWSVVKQRIDESNHGSVANVGMFGSSSSTPLSPSCQEPLSRHH